MCFCLHFELTQWFSLEQINRYLHFCYRYRWPPLLHTSQIWACVVHYRSELFLHFFSLTFLDFLLVFLILIIYYPVLWQFILFLHQAIFCMPITGSKFQNSVSKSFLATAFLHIPECTTIFPTSYILDKSVSLPRHSHTPFSFFHRSCIFHSFFCRNGKTLTFYFSSYKVLCPALYLSFCISFTVFLSFTPNVSQTQSLELYVFCS